MTPNYDRAFYQIVADNATGRALMKLFFAACLAALRALFRRRRPDEAIPSLCDPSYDPQVHGRRP